MTDSAPPPPSPLAEQALQRLRKLAEGNGVAPEAIQLFSAEEKTYALEGTMILSPLFETASTRYAGPVRGSNRRVVEGSAALKAEVQRLQQDFQGRYAWIADAIAQLKEQPASGWGLDDVRISLPRLSTTLACGEVCPACQGAKLLTCQQCQGQAVIVCPQCQGNRQEICPVCIGQGRNPAMPDQPCITCNGLRYVPCRFCHGRGQLTCPTCQGRRGTTCSACNGAGMVTEEVAISCGARTSFRLKGEGMPSGLRRGLDRLGIANLAKGHADIETLAPPDEEDDAVAPMSGAMPEAKKEKPPKPEVHYLAHLPYADLRMDFAGKKVIVGVFGKKQVLLGVPAFLDTALEPMRDKLQQAATGKAGLEDALQVRALKDALKLQLAGRGQVNDLRRIYPLGLSPKTAEEILKNMRLALNQITFRARGLVAAACVAASGGIFAGIFFSPLHRQITADLKVPVVLAVDAGCLCVAMVACWFALSSATRFVLQRRFPDLKMQLTQKTGKTGHAMLAAIIVAFVAIVLLAPDKQEWVGLLMR